MKLRLYEAPLIQSSTPPHSLFIEGSHMTKNMASEQAWLKLNSKVWT